MRLAMFPLGTVLFPHMVLPLHVFEPRYRALTRDCLGADGPMARSFGITLIERGAEVGGGDSRFGVGCVAHIEEYEELPDGRFALLVRGDVRLRVASWLPEDPYPAAEVELLGEGPAPDGSRGLLRACETRVRTALAHQAELGLPTPPATIELSADPRRAGWELCALVPAGPLDRQRLLELGDDGERLRLLESLAADAVDLLARRLASG